MELTDIEKALRARLVEAQKLYPELKGAYWMEDEQILKWIPPDRGYVDSFRMYLAKNLEDGRIAWGKLEFGYRTRREAGWQWGDRVWKFLEDFAKAVREGTVQVIQNDQEVLG